MDSLLIGVDWEQCPVPRCKNPAVEDYARQKFGAVPVTYQYLGHSEWFCHALTDLLDPTGRLQHVEHEFGEVMIMAVSQDRGCRYCFAVSRVLLQLMGNSPSDVHRIEQALSDAGTDDRQAAALRFVRRLSRSDPLIGAQDCEQLQAAGFNGDELREIAFLAATAMVANIASTAIAVPPQPFESLGERFGFRLFLPILALAYRRRVNAVAAQSETCAYDGPFAYQAELFADLPAGARLARVLARTWAPSLLSQRCKLLLFAVVARGLGTCQAMGESTCLLAEEGLAGRELENLLAHLRGPELTPVESALLPYARQTLWYRPVVLQRQTRALLQQVSVGELVEAVGILALANALCRLETIMGAY